MLGRLGGVLMLWFRDDDDVTALSKLIRPSANAIHAGTARHAKLLKTRPFKIREANSLFFRGMARTSKRTLDKDDC
jgi:hypothetical protein